MRQKKVKRLRKIFTKIKEQYPPEAWCHLWRNFKKVFARKPIKEVIREQKDIPSRINAGR
jgi:hypothetical protein